MNYFAENKYEILFVLEGDQGFCKIMLLNIAFNSARAPCLLSGSLRLPHLGECTQEGQPLSHPQLSIASRVALSHC